MVKPGGNIVVLAVFEKRLEIEFNDVVAKNISLHGSLEWSRREIPQAFELITSGRIDRKRLITHEFALNDVKEAYETQANVEQSIKTMIKP
jgi:threonine dehydrogenase-like Zn-dependent dehydrogenase